MMMVKSLENTKCKATQENLDKLLKLVGNTISSYKQALYYEAYFYVKDNILNWGHKDCIDPAYWNNFTTIHLVDGQFQYIEETVIKEKPKNNFEEYGFKADFEGEILKEVDGYYIGWANVLEYGIESCKWSKSGDTNYSVYNLKPIKTEWYENPDNFPCVIISLKTNKPHIAYTYNHLEEKIKQETFSTNPDKFRPATKEEVLSLLVKEE